MPRKLTDADGNEIEVPTDEEIEALKQEVEKAKQLDPDKEKNFKALRDKQKILIESLKVQGKNVDDEGNIIEDAKMTAEDISKIADERTIEKLFQLEKEKVRIQLPEKDREVFDYYFNKLMTGEEKTITNLMKFADEAKNFVYPQTSDNRLNRAMSAPLGGVPNSKDNEISSTTKEMAKDFGYDEKDLADASPEIKITK